MKSPKRSELIAFRAVWGLSQTAAAKLAGSSLRAWQYWEAGEHPMHPAIWDSLQSRAEKKALGVPGPE